MLCILKTKSSVVCNYFVYFLTLEKNTNEGNGNDTSMGDSELLDAVPPEIR